MTIITQKVEPAIFARHQALMVHRSNENQYVYHALGFNVIPTDRAKKPLVKWASAPNWKITRQTPDDLAVMPWQRARGIAAVCGAVSGGLAVVDFDKQPDRDAVDQFLAALGLPGNYPWLVKTPGGGWHVWLTSPRGDKPAGEKIDGRWDRPGLAGGHIELRYEGVLAMLPPSIHPNGGRYVFVNGAPDGPPATVDLDRLSAAYDRVTEPPPAVEKHPEPARRETVPGTFKDLYERWCVEVVEQAAIRTWAIPPTNGQGLSRRNFSSPLRDDHHPSAQWSYTAHGFKDYGTGEFYNTHTVAALLGVPAWDDFKRECTVRRQTKKRPPLAEAIQPVSLPDFEAHQTVNMRYISELPVDVVLKHRAVLVKSPVGTGKTALVKRLIAALDRSGTANVLVVTHRQALAADIAARLGLECYQTIPDDRLVQAHRLVITYNSLHKISASDRPWDLVVIDEIEQFHQHLFGETFRGGEAHRAHTALTDVLSRARHFVGLDAHLTAISALWTHRTLNVAPYLIHNTYQHDWGELTLHQREDSLVAAALQAAQQQRGPVVITTSSRHRAEIYFRLVCEAIGPDGVRLVTGENSSSADTQQFIARINHDLPRLRVLICTPSFGTGLDVTARVYGVFGVMLNRPLVATDMIQMIGRFRHADQRHVYVQPLHQAEPVDWLARWGEALDADADTRRAAEFAPHGIGPLPVSQHDILLLAAQLTSAADRQKTDLLSYFAAYVQVEGFTLAYRDGEHRPTRDAIRAARHTLAEERKTCILAAAPVSRDQYERYQEAGQISPDIVAGYERWTIETTVGLPLTGTIYDDLHTPAHRAALRRLADLITDVEALKARDRQEAREQVLLMQRGHYTTTQALITDILLTVFGPNGLDSDAELTAAAITRTLQPFLDQHLAAVQRLIDRRDDMSTHPLYVLRRVLKAVGLKLARRQVMVQGQRFMVYWIDGETRAHWLDYARARLAHLAAGAAITTDSQGGNPLQICSKSGTAPPGEEMETLDIVRDIVCGRGPTAPRRR
jgi:hypothetical protein